MCVGVVRVVLVTACKHYSPCVQCFASMSLTALSHARKEEYKLALYQCHGTITRFTFLLQQKEHDNVHVQLLEFVNFINSNPKHFVTTLLAKDSKLATCI